MPLKFREHFFSVFNKLWSLIIFIFALALIFFQYATEYKNLHYKILLYQIPLIIAVAVIVLIYMLYVIGDYFLTYYTVNDKGILMEKSFIYRRTTALPFENIHTVSEKVSLAGKYVNVKKISLDSGSYNEQAEFDFILNRNTADMLVEKITSHFADNSNANIKKESCLQNKWLLLYALLLPSKWLKFVGYSLSVITIVAIAITSNNSLPLFVVILSYISAVIISIIINMLYTYLKYYSFSLKNGDKFLTISYGKLIKTVYNIPYDSINGIIIKQSLAGRLSKTFHPFLYVVGYKNIKEKFSLPLFPIANKAMLAKILKDFIQGFDFPADFKQPPPKAKRNYFFMPFIQFNFIMLPLTVVFFIYGEYIFTVIYFIMNTLLYFEKLLSYKETRFGFNNDILYVKKGGLGNSQLICKKTAIQSIKIINTNKTAEKKLAKISFQIKSVKGKDFKLGYLEKEDYFI